MLIIDTLNNHIIFHPSELLEAPSDAGELQAVTKAKILYRSCMNESKLQTCTQLCKVWLWRLFICSFHLFLNQILTLS